MGAETFVAVASAIPEQSSNPTTVRMLIAHSQEQAQAVKKRLMSELGEMLRRRGDRVVDVESG